MTLFIERAVSVVAGNGSTVSEVEIGYNSLDQ